MMNDENDDLYLNVPTKLSNLKALHLSDLPSSWLLVRMILCIGLKKGAAKMRKAEDTQSRKIFLMRVPVHIFVKTIAQTYCCPSTIGPFRIANPEETL